MHTPFAVLLLLFLVSGATGLVYELVWTRELVFVFGGTTHAISTVLTAFMGGLGLGSYAIGRYTRRMSQPGVVYGVLEIIIGLYALAVPLLLALAEPLYRGIYPHVQDQMGLLTAVRFVVGFAILIVPTTLMGATLPVLVRYVVLRGGQLGQSVGVLYGVNSSGAVLGTLATGFLLIPLLGLTRATYTAAAANVLVGVVGLVLLRLPRTLESGGRGAARGAAGRSDERGLTPLVRRAVLVTFALSGFASMVYQVMWTRTLVTAIGSSTYAFTCILAAFILGLALGSIVVARFVDRLTNLAPIIGGAVALIGVAAMWIAPAYGEIPGWVYQWVRDHRENFSAVVRFQFALIVAVTAIPTLLMGALFPLVTRAVSRGAEDAGAATGRAYGVNTIGTLLGSFMAGFILIRSDLGDQLGVPLGVRNALLYASLLNVLAGAALLALGLRRGPELRAGTRWAVFGISGAALAGLVLTPRALLDWNVLVMNSGAFYGQRDVDWMLATHEVAYYGEGVDLNVLVARSKETNDLTLFVNGTPNASTNIDDMTTNELLGHLPMLLASTPREVCLIGLGCGVTLGSIVQHPEAEHVDAVEISGQVIHGAAEFNAYAYNVCDPGQAPDKLRMIRNDGRNHLLLTDRRYDVIVSEPSHPWMAGVANLFTREFFELCRDRMTPDGVTAVWLHGYKISVENFRLVVRTLFSVFPDVSIWRLGTDDFLMVASQRPQPLPADEWLARFRRPAVRSDLYRVGMGRPERVLELFLASGAPLRAWAGEGELHTDDNALLEFRTPTEFHEDNGAALTAAFERLGCTLFDHTLAPLPDAEAQGRLAAGIAQVAESERLFAQARRMVSAGRLLDALEPLRAAYALDPGDFGIYLYELWIQQVVEADRTGLRTGDAYRAHRRLWRRMPAPPQVSASGESLPDIARRQLAAGRGALQQNLPSAAVGYLEEAAELLPDDAEIAVARAEAHLANGDAERARALISRAVERGIVPASLVPEALQASPDAPGGG